MALTPNQRKAALIERGVKMVDIAREVGVSPATVSLTNTEERHNPGVREAIARAIGKPTRSVWPPVRLRQSA